MYFKWKDDYKVDVSEIDSQHKKLFEIGGRISELMGLDDEYDHYDEIKEIFEELKDYTAYHFGYEEKLMEKYGYKDLDAHKIEHAFMVKKINKLEKKDFDEDQRGISLDLVSFVSDWITGHILNTDLQYKEFFSKAGVK